MRPLLLVALTACTGSHREPLAPSPLFDVGQTEEWRLPGLHGPAYVMRTEANIPRIYAVDDIDLARVNGFTYARDRFFVLDLSRRLSTGRVSVLLGDAAFSTDAESRSNGMTHVAEMLDRTMSDEQRVAATAFTDGINAYIEAVRAGALPPPSEYDLAAPLLGKDAAVDLMEPFESSDVAAMGATLVYQLGYETGDVGNQATVDAMAGMFQTGPLADLRRAGLYDDIWLAQEPVFPIVSADGWQLDTRARPPLPFENAGNRIPKPLADRLTKRLDGMQARFGRDHAMGWGSNAWAVMGEGTADGRALLAGDGHLPLSVPSLFWSVGFDTEHLGGGNTHEVGVVLPGLPNMIAVGTNGRVAWSQTQLMGDITDWYREELVLTDGAPTATMFQGKAEPLVPHSETVEIADIPVLDSVGRTVTWERYETFDGRWIADVEGRDVGEDYVPASGEHVLRFGGSLVVPEDIDGDGKIVAVSFDYTGLDDSNVFRVLDAWGHADTVEDMREASKGLVAYSQNIAAADVTGSVLYTGYQAVPCRGYLPRNPDGSWVEGADPSLLLDGTTYGAFRIPMTADLKVDESQAADPYACVVPFDKYPQALDPVKGYVVTANNDPGGATIDGTLANDPYYIGGPWTEGYRADTIDRTLAAEVTDKSASLESMATLQGNTTSRLGEQLSGYLLDAIDHVQAEALAGSADPDTARFVAIYQEDAATVDAAEVRLRAWAANGYPASSGVETFYHTPVDGEIADSVATSIFNAWFGRFMGRVTDDEGFPGVWTPTGGTGRMRFLNKILAGRGPGNPGGLASYNPDTEESAFFDVLATPEIERSDELMLRAFVDGLAFLKSPETTPGHGGFGSADMDTWTWGLKHWVHFDSLLGDFLPSDSSFSFLLDQFSITPERLPVMDGLPPTDPRDDMPGFPRAGDNFAVDAANSGMGGDNFQYGSGPVFRLVVALGPEGVDGVNILPGGQSGLNDDPHFDDQVGMWLGNKTYPLHVTVDEVAGAATGRETFLPDAPGW